MKKRSRIQIRPIFILAAVLALFISLRIRVRADELRYSSNFGHAQKFILLIIDYQSLFCPVCLENFQNFCDLLRSSGQEESAMGVLIFQVSDKGEDMERIEKIIEKQVRGLVIGSNIRFPFLYDEAHVFEGIDLEGATIILVDRSRALLKKYTLPLTLEQKEEVFFDND